MTPRLILLILVWLFSLPVQGQTPVAEPPRDLCLQSLNAAGLFA